eukprot:TRINITY_DN3161_c3_g4_i1.p1 TRINITY_DN3161_c3_g4~~TRINITY_DN3161_c3_g4_i1.p1  ORF type:complete len:331 (+),score=82.21 TRINITY_DN3161_c3_g4_i1:57-1049(+)
MASEDLYELRNALTLGNYNQVISEAPSIKPSPYATKATSQGDLMIEKDYLLARAQMGLKRYSAAVRDLENSTERSHRALLHLAEYLKADSSTAREAAVEGAKEVVESAMKEEGEASEKSCLMAITAATVLIHAGELNTAHMWIKTWISNLSKKETAQEPSSCGANALLLELHAMLIDIYLRINRIEHAESELKAMDKIDDDAAISMLWHGYVRLRKGGEKDVKEALRDFMDLKEKYGNSTLLLNACALCYMASKDYSEALKVLEEALSIRESDVDVMVNTMICQKQLRPGADIKPMLDIVKSSNASHPWIWEYNRLSQGFDDAAALVQNL